MENAIRPARAHFHLLFCLKSDLGLSWRHLRSILGRLGKSFGPSWAPKTPPRCATWAPRRDQDLAKSGPKHLPRRTWQPKTAKNLKNLENDPQKSMRYPSGPRFWSLHGCIWDHFGEDFGTLFAPHFGPMLTSIFDIFE